jgi:MoxR-like ATPase
LDAIQQFTQRVVDNVERVIVGKRDEVTMVLVALLCEGHLLVEDVPGVGKTMMSRAVARSLGCSYARIQFTPDLLPSDITGITMYNQKSSEFEFRPGPVHHQIVLGDEINRAPPKTQSALLECMEERTVTADGVTHALPRPFLVMATQNPVEYEGTFPLPEAQLDRFMLRIRLGYPSLAAESEMLARQQLKSPLDDLQQVVTAEELQAMQHKVREVHVDATLREYIVKLVQRTRESSMLYLGASPRGSIAVFRGAQAWAAMQSREYCIPDDIKKVTIPALSHRMISKTDGVRGTASVSVLREALDTVPVPQ